MLAETQQQQLQNPVKKTSKVSSKKRNVKRSRKDGFSMKLVKQLAMYSRVCLERNQQKRNFVKCLISGEVTIHFLPFNFLNLN